MNVEPLGLRVLVRPIESEAKTASGLILPDSAKEKPIEGRVKAVGDGKLNESGNRVKIDLKVGDKVLYGKYAGTEIKIDGEDYLLMREDDILGVVTK